MTLVVSRDGSMLRIGRKSFKLWPARGVDGTRLCESGRTVSFTTIRHLRAADFPMDLELIIDPAKNECCDSIYLSIMRRSDSIYFKLVFDYFYRKWMEHVSLKDFITNLAGDLNELQWLKAYELDDSDGQGLAIELRAEFGIAGRLGDHYRSMVLALTLTRARVIARLSNKLRTALLSDIRSSSVPASMGRVRAKPLAFICHDSRDKDRVARPIARGLAALDCPVWYDEFSLHVGDRLRESIESGLQQVNKCILIISPRFLRNEGWSKAEFESIFARELVERKDIFLPVWVGVTPQQVFEYSPALVNRVGVSWNRGVDEVVRQLRLAVKRTVRNRLRRSGARTRTDN
ncbi:toll/interleukin-1 receptor domain-containing protein [Steroidobacter flavus]|uniref:Toll/interleukin-1 receptor domain-containing protein n=1 Tax=Steroidobacter flavus TaxID=1842136 RepID=A0ABV8SRC9_9GAMM